MTKQELGPRERQFREHREAKLAKADKARVTKRMVRGFGKGGKRVKGVERTDPCQTEGRLSLASSSPPWLNPTAGKARAAS